MRTINLLATLIISCLLIISCKKDDDESDSSSKVKSNSENKILILGASRVEGNRPEYESFRYDLWKLLKADSLTFDFIGTNTDEGAYENFNGTKFDTDHEGHGGLTARSINNNLNNWLNATGAPDIVLLSSPGGNDALENQAYEGTITAINSIIDKLQSLNPNVIIIIEELAPAHSSVMTGNLESYFDKFKTDIPLIVSQQSDGVSQIVTVNMSNDFSDTYLADDVHYNLAGANFIAQRYYDILQPYLN